MVDLMKSPTDRWMGYLETAAARKHLHEDNILYKFVETVILTDLQKYGLQFLLKGVCRFP